MLGVITSGHTNDLYDTSVSTKFRKRSGKVRKETVVSFLNPKTLEILLSAGAPNNNFRKISVRKTICDLEFSEHLL